MSFIIKKFISKLDLVPIIEDCFSKLMKIYYCLTMTLPNDYFLVLCLILITKNFLNSLTII